MQETAGEIILENSCPVRRDTSGLSAICQFLKDLPDRSLDRPPQNIKSIFIVASVVSCSAHNDKCVAQVGSRLLLFGGADAHQQHFADIHSFDEESGKWKKVGLASLLNGPLPRVMVGDEDSTLSLLQAIFEVAMPPVCSCVRRCLQSGDRLVHGVLLQY